MAVLHAIQTATKLVLTRQPRFYEDKSLICPLYLRKWVCAVHHPVSALRQSRGICPCLLRPCPTYKLSSLFSSEIDTDPFVGMLRATPLRS